MTSPAPTEPEDRRERLMAHAVICPVCHGKGRLIDPASEWSTEVIYKTCHGCDGKGWVEVSEK